MANGGAGFFGELNRNQDMEKVCRAVKRKMVSFPAWAGNETIFGCLIELDGNSQKITLH